MTMLVPKVSGFFIEGGNIVVPSDTLAEAAIAEDVQLPPSANVGTVVFFRSPKLAGLGTRYKVREDDRELGKLSRATYFAVQVPAGTHHYWAFYEGPDLSRSMSNLVRPTTSAASSRRVCLTPTPISHPRTKQRLNP
jgi:hypothetical protein